MDEQRDYQIAHLFADFGVESEVLARLGTVTRYTIDPRSNAHVDETVQMDLMDEMPAREFDLAVLHPRCTDCSDMTSISGDPADHPNQIPRARQIAREIASDYVIENKPRDDLRNPTVLNGRMFGLPVAYERAFETSFRVQEPPRERALCDKTVSPYFFADRTREWWEVVKGVHGDYPKQHLAKNALPAPYTRFIARSWLESLETRDSQEVQDNDGPAPRTVAAGQTRLTEENR